MPLAAFFRAAENTKSGVSIPVPHAYQAVATFCAATNNQKQTQKTQISNHTTGVIALDGNASVGRRQTPTHTLPRV